MIQIGLTNYTPTTKILYIQDKNSVVKAVYAIGAKDVLKQTLMGEHYIELSFELNSVVSFKRSDYIEWESDKYTLRSDYIPEQVNKQKYKYTLRFEAVEMLFQDIQFYYLNQNLKESEWRLTGNPLYFINIAVDNINRYFGTTDFTAGAVEPAEIIDISFDTNTNTFDALTQIADKCDGEWHLTGKQLRLLNKFSFGSGVDFETDVSVLSMKREEGDSSAKYTRIVALGSTRNIPYNYRESSSGEAIDAIYSKRLRIPLSKGDVIDAYPDMLPEEVAEGTVIFDEVYPKRIGTIEKVGTIEYTDTDQDTGEKTKWNAYKFTDPGIKFKEEYVLPGQELKLSFQSGNLNGRDFALIFHESGFSSTDKSQFFEIVRTEEYGKELPNDIMKPEPGDKYVLYGFDIALVSDQYVPEAEQELYETAVAWQQKQLQDTSVYNCQTIIKHFMDNLMDLEIGQEVRLVHEQFESGYRISRIMGFEKKLNNKYDGVYTVGDNPTYSTLGKIEKDIKELQQAGISENVGGGPYVIKQFDSTKPTNFNVYSSLRSSVEYLHKNREDSARKLIHLLEGGKFGEFIHGPFGDGAYIDEHGNGEMTSLTLRSFLEAPEFRYNRIQVVGGELYATNGSVISNVEYDDGSYLITLKIEEGDHVPFMVDDILLGSYLKPDGFFSSYMRIIHIDDAAHTIRCVLGEDAEVPGGKNREPVPFMNLVQYGNFTDESRQNSIRISSHDQCVVMLGGVNKYLTDKSHIHFGIGAYKNFPVTNLPVRDDDPIVYVRALAAEQFHQIGYDGRVKQDIIDRGLWSLTTALSDEPYRNLANEAHDVWHHSCRYRCITDKTTQEPWWNSTGWLLISGDTRLTMKVESSEGTLFRPSDLNTTLTATVYRGSEDITADINDIDWSWTRDSGDILSDTAWNASHTSNRNTVNLTITDMGDNWLTNRKVKFTCTAYVRDGEETESIQQIINYNL